MITRQKIIFSILIFGIVALVLFSGCAKPPEIKKPPEIQLIKTNEFKHVLDKTVNPNMINDEGVATRNLNGLVAVSEQRVCKGMIMRGIADNNEKLIEKGVKAIEYGFDHQNEDGSFQYSSKIRDLGATDADLLEAGTFFMQAVGHSYLLIEQSKYSDKYLQRLDKLKAKMRLTMEWLKNNKETLLKKAANAPNRLVFDALAFKLNGIILNDQKYQQIGDQFVRESLKKQRDDGTFLEHGGHDTSYQAVSLLKLQIYWLYSNNENLNAQINSAVKKGVAWEKAKIKDSGEVNVEGNTRTGSCQEIWFGKCKDVNYPQVIESFLYYAEINDDKESEIIAGKVLDYAIKK